MCWVMQYHLGVYRIFSASNVNLHRRPSNSTAAGWATGWCRLCYSSDTGTLAAAHCIFRCAVLLLAPPPSNYCAGRHRTISS